MRTCWSRTVLAAIGIAACWLVVPSNVSPQSTSALGATADKSRPRAAAASNEAVKRGEAWFYQRCSLCHMGRVVKDDTYQPMAPRLDGVLRNASPDREKLVRELVQRGSLRMPGFRYNFTPAEFEELMAYLKTL